MFSANYLHGVLKKTFFSWKTNNEAEHHFFNLVCVFFKYIRNNRFALKRSVDSCFNGFLLPSLHTNVKFMFLPFIYLTDLRDFYTPAIIEMAKVLLVSVGWIGGLTAFVYWKDKHPAALVIKSSN